MQTQAIKNVDWGACGTYVSARFAELCDGSRSIGQIIDIVGNERSLERVLLATDLRALADAWIRAGWLAECDGALSITEHGLLQLHRLRSGQPGLTRFLWDITRRCNLKCDHCYSYRDDEHAGELTLQEISTVLDQLASMPPYLVVYGGGEPFYRKDFVDILARTKAAVKCRIKVLTNGTLLLPRVLDAVKRYVDFFQFSLDGRQENHELMRGADRCFEKTCRAISLAAAEGIPFGICMTLNRRNIGDIDWMLDFALAHGAYKLRLSPLVLAGKALKSASEWAIPGAELKALYDRLLEYRIRYKNKLHLDFRDELYGNAFLDGCADEESSPRGVPYFLCAAGRSLLYVNPEGHVTPCNFIDTPRYHLGNVKTTDIRTIWESHPMLHQVRGLSVDNIAKCSTCGRKRRCGGGLRCNAVMLSGDFAAADPLCRFYEKQRAGGQRSSLRGEVTP